MAASKPPAATAAPADQAMLQGEQLRLLFRTGAAILVNLVNAVIIATILWRHLPSEPLVAWVALMLIVTTARLLLRHRYFTAPASFSPRTWLNLYALGAGLTGAVWGLSSLVILWSDYVPLHMLVGLTGAGMIAGALALLYVYPAALLAFTAPYVLPMATAFFVHGTAPYVGLGLMTVVYGAALSFAAHIFSSAFRESVALRIDLARANVDLEERVEARTAALRTSERQLRLLADNLPIFIGYIDSNERYIFVNRLGEQWYQRPASEILGKRLTDILRPEHYEKLRPFRERAFAGTPVQTEQQITYPDGSTRWVEVRYIPDFGDGGEVRGLYTAIVEVTERKEMQAELAQSQKMEAIGQLAGGIAHDFNNLLGVIVGNLDLLGALVGNRPQERDHIQRAIAAAERGVELTQRVLAFGRRQTLQPRLINSNDLVAEMSKLLVGSLGAAIELRLKPGEGLWDCIVDPGQLENAVLNLCLNARDAMPAGGTLTIETSNVYIGGASRLPAAMPPGDYIRITVSDTGTGMTADVAARAFDPYFTTKEAGKGTGLGLSMVYGFARQSGGQAVITSEPGRGTSVHMYFPRAVAAAPEARGRRQPETPQPGHGELILVVEDNEALREVSVTMLRQLGYRTMPAVNGTEALARLAREPAIELLFTDIGLPGGMTGFDVANEALKLRPGLRVLFTTGYAEPRPDSSPPLPVNAEILAKPFRAAELARAVRAAFAARAR